MLSLLGSLTDLIVSLIHTRMRLLLIYSGKPIPAPPPYHYAFDTWEKILEEHGIDLGWVIDEEDRRQQAMTGETSAHEVSVGTDITQVLQMTKRRTYEYKE